jgi:hypothetical protein
MCMIVEQIDDLVRLVFEDGQLRAFKADGLRFLEVVSLPDTEADELRRKLKKKIPSKSAATAKAKKKKVVAKAAAAAKAEEELDA